MLVCDGRRSDVGGEIAITVKTARESVRVHVQCDMMSAILYCSAHLFTTILTRFDLITRAAYTCVHVSHTIDQCCCHDKPGRFISILGSYSMTTSE